MAIDAEIYVPAEDEEDDGGDYDGDGNDGNDAEEEFDGDDNPAQVEDDGENNDGEEEEEKEEEEEEEEDDDDDDDDNDDPAAECLVCSLCKRTCWETHESLVKHRKRHKNKRKELCSLCGRLFTDDDVFDNHVCECRN